MKRSVALRLNDANDNKSEPASLRSEADLYQDFGHAREGSGGHGKLFGLGRRAFEENRHDLGRHLVTQNTLHTLKAERVQKREKTWRVPSA